VAFSANAGMLPRLGHWFSFQILNNSFAIPPFALHSLNSEAMLSNPLIKIYLLSREVIKRGKNKYKSRFLLSALTEIWVVDFYNGNRLKRQDYSFTIYNVETNYNNNC
jgi:hypothetical protein